MLSLTLLLMAALFCLISSSLLLMQLARLLLQWLLASHLRLMPSFRQLAMVPTIHWILQVCPASSSLQQKILASSRLLSRRLLSRIRRTRRLGVSIAIPALRSSSLFLFCLSWLLVARVMLTIVAMDGQPSSLLFRIFSTLRHRAPILAAMSLALSLVQRFSRFPTVCQQVLLLPSTVLTRA